MLIEHLDQLGEVHERAGEAVDLVDDDDILVGADPTSWKPETWIFLAYLAFGVTILGYVCWYWALGRGGVARIGLLQFLQPVSGQALSPMILNERPDFGVMIASIIILLGTIIATRSS